MPTLIKIRITVSVKLPRPLLRIAAQRRGTRGAALLAAVLREATGLIGLDPRPHRRLDGYLRARGGEPVLFAGSNNAKVCFRVRACFPTHETHRVLLDAGRGRVHARAHAGGWLGGGEGVVG